MRKLVTGQASLRRFGPSFALATQARIAARKLRRAGQACSGPFKPGSTPSRHVPVRTKLERARAKLHPGGASLNLPEQARTRTRQGCQPTALSAATVRWLMSSRPTFHRVKFALTEHWYYRGTEVLQRVGGKANRRLIAEHATALGSANQHKCWSAGSLKLHFRCQD